ncbi:winged helix-turn-helix transcriptional regulator [Limosilactobacillus fermentum]|uniref:winged helix-turn-helix transcriptional regulator n=1 Tax=Limosilactobacillus fermentum TaxID=1613 RepID=UPI003D77D1B8
MYGEHEAHGEQDYPHIHGEHVTDPFSQANHQHFGLDRLKELELANIINRRVFPETPPHVEYSLTKKGEELLPIFEAMRTWGNTWEIMK